MSRYLDPGEPAGFPWEKLLLAVFVAGLCFVLGAVAGLALLAKYGDFPPVESAAAYRPSVTSMVGGRGLFDARMQPDGGATGFERLLEFLGGPLGRG